MYVCTTDELTVTFSSTIPVDRKTIVVPYVDTNAKVTNFFPFCTIGISMYQKRISPYFIIPYFLTPSLFLFGAFQTEKFHHPLLPKFFFFPLSAWGPTHRPNSTGLAELWGGWPIEQASMGVIIMVNVKNTMTRESVGRQVGT